MPVPPPLIEPPPGELLQLRLYVRGATPKSARAVVQARQFCESQFPGRYRLEILEIGDHIAQATADEVVGTPTLMRLAPLPLRRFIGDLSDVRTLRQGLQLEDGDPG
jgi:circadian clock protein KaiB